MYLDNSFYSHRRILSKYCGIKDKRCFASIQHGSHTLKQEKIIGKRFFSISPFLCWNKRLLKITKKNNIPNVFCIGAPFLYLDILMKNKKFKKPKGTLVFPSKSSVNKNTDVNHLKLIEMTEKRFNGPYTICVYFADLKKDWSIYKLRGWKIISFGDRYKKNFLQGVYNQIKLSKNIVVTSIDTVAFYSMFLKKKVYFITKYKKKNRVFNIVTTKNKLQDHVQNYYKKKFPKLLKNKSTINERFFLACNELGYNCVKSKNELKKILGFDNKLKIFFAKILSFYFRFRHA